MDAVDIIDATVAVNSAPTRLRLRRLRWRGTAKIVALLAILGSLSGATVSAQRTSIGNDLWNDVTLYRDSYGTPHIHGASVRSTAFAFGYAQAADHLEPMLMAYRMALGRGAEVGGEHFAEGDAFAIKIANAETTRLAMANADAITRDLCEGFALGINAWILEHQDAVAPWVEGVQPMDVLAYWHFLMVTSAPFDLPGIYHPERPLPRANAWALGPEKSANGTTILVMNPHQYYRAPYQWYEAHIMVGDVNVSGATLFGVPALMMGHNTQLGWALTPNEADIADFFKEDMAGPDRNPSDPTLPSIMAEIAPVLSFMSTAKTYHVRNGSVLEERAVPSYVGVRGPMMEGGDGGLYSWRNGAYGQFGGLRQLMLMAQAKDLAAFQEAMLIHQLPCFQILYADAVGNLFYLYNARTGNKNAALSPKDKKPLDWTQPIDPSRDQFAWASIVAPGNLPNLLNPESGYLQACGTPPWLATTESGLTPADWPSWLVPEDSSYRAYRVNQILSAGPYVFEDMNAMLFDTLVPAAVDMVPLLLAMAEARPELVRKAHPDLVTGLNLLRNWNLTADRDADAVAFYSQWWSIMKSRYQADFPTEAALYRGLLANSASAQYRALEAAADAARTMRNDYNRLAIPWGEFHRLQRGNYNEALFGTDAGDPIFVVGDPANPNGRPQSDFGYGFAMAVEFGESIRGMSVVPFGASEKPGSPHYSDQLPLFVDRRMKDTHFAYEDVIQHAQSGYGRQIVLGVPGLEGYCRFSMTMPTAMRLEAVAYPPRPYPGGQVLFTPAVKPVAQTAPKEIPWELQWRVSEERCKPEHMARLRFHRYTREDGWTPVLHQSFDEETGLFTAKGTGVTTIGLMGPSDFFIAPVSEDDVPLDGPPAEASAGEVVPHTGAFDAGTMAKGHAGAGVSEAGPPPTEGSGTTENENAPGNGMSEETPADTTEEDVPEGEGAPVQTGPVVVVQDGIEMEIQAPEADPGTQERPGFWKRLRRGEKKEKE